MSFVTNYISGLSLDQVQHIVKQAGRGNWLSTLLVNAPDIQWLQLANYAVPSRRDGVAQKMAGETRDTPPEVLNDYITINRHD